MRSPDPRVAQASLAAVTADPALERSVVEAAIAGAAKSGKELNLLAAYLAEKPDGLTTGASDAPLVVGRVVDALRALGAVGLCKPRCARCGHERRLPYRTGAGRMCTGCYVRANAEECQQCGVRRPVVTRDAAGPVCQQCHAKDPATHETCGKCGRAAPVTARTPGGPVCPRCYQRPLARCDGCGRDAQIHSRRGGRALCDGCYTSPPGPCRLCGESSQLAVAAQHGQAGICYSCYEYPQVACASCGRVRPCSVRSELGPLCQACAPRPVRECRRCGRHLPAQRIDAEGAVCTGCYDHVHRRTCVRCGELCRPYEAETCARCVLRSRLSDLLGVAQGHPSDLQPLFDALVATDQPRSVLGWVRRSDGVEILARLARGEIPLSHEGLDSLGRSKPVDHVRGLLMAAGLLAEVDVRFERLEPWLEGLLLEVPSAHARLIRPFAVWRVFRRARRKADADGFTENGAKWARLRVRQALTFLEWLDDHGIELADLGQADVDLWLAGGTSTRYVVRDFLRWAADRGLVSANVDVPARQVLTPAAALDEDERWEQVEWLLSDEGVDLSLRVAGLLALLFGQHLSRVVRLRWGQVTIDGGVSLRLGSDDIRLPPRLDELVAELRAHTGHAAVLHGDWLFPGGTPGRPLTVEQLRKRLAGLGIVLRPTRQAALLQLASDLPAPVLSDLLGLHPNTAVEWVRTARGDWAAYAATGPSRRPE